MKEEKNDVYFMKIAVNEAKKALTKGEVPIGCVVVKNKKIIAQTHNLKETTKNPLMHAELFCILKAAKKLGNWRLCDVIMYTTMEPCLMCFGAIYEARISKLVYGISNTRNETRKIIKHAKYNHQLIIKKGILNMEIEKLMKRFFNQIRVNDKE